MSKGNTFENDWLKLIFNATSIGTIAGPATSGALTNLHVSLHDADPGEAGDQTTNEATYGGYGRVAVARTTAGWVVSGNSVSPVASITFPECTGGTTTAGFAAIGTASAGAGKLLYSGAISPTIAISVGVTPSLTTSSVISEE